MYIEKGLEEKKKSQTSNRGLPQWKGAIQQRLFTFTPNASILFGFFMINMYYFILLFLRKIKHKYTYTQYKGLRCSSL